MKVERRAFRKSRPILAAIVAGLLGATALTTSFTGSAAAFPSQYSTAGRGFDTCTAPASDVMDTWLAG
jgi:hypothetical protein